MGSSGCARVEMRSLEGGLTLGETLASKRSSWSRTQMDRKLTDLVELDVDDATKLFLLDEMLNLQQEALSSGEIRSLFWIAILSLSVRHFFREQPFRSINSYI